MATSEIQLKTHFDEAAPPVPRLSFMQKVIADRFGQRRAEGIASHIQSNYDLLYARRPIFSNAALRDHLESWILPGLALYQSFRAEGMTEAEALDETRYMLTGLINRVRTRWINLLAHLPGTYTLFRRMVRRTMNRRFVQPGFDLEWIEDSPRRIAFTMKQCLYHNTLTAYGAPELTAIYCHLDDIWGAALLPKVIFERPHTIGRGDSVCDFCYRCDDPGPGGALFDIRWGNM